VWGPLRYDANRSPPELFCSRNRYCGGVSVAGQHKRLLRNRIKSGACCNFFMMLELQRPFPVQTPIGYGWAIIVSRESGLANDIWTCAMERDGAVRHFRSDQIFALPNGTLDISTTPTPTRHDQIQNRRQKNP
jgi:hypothetical protein